MGIIVIYFGVLFAILSRPPVAHANDADADEVFNNVKEIITAEVEKAQDELESISMSGTRMRTTKNEVEPATIRDLLTLEKMTTVETSTDNAMETTIASTEDYSTTQAAVNPPAAPMTSNEIKTKSRRRIDGGQALPLLGLSRATTAGPTVLQILRNLRASTFVQLLIATGLDFALENSGPYTVFAPTDDAFNRLSFRVQKQLQTDVEKLRQVLYYHIVPGQHESKHLRNELRLRTLAKSNATVIVRVYADKKPTINSALLTVPDARASNGLVHIVSDVIYPIPVGTVVETLRACPAMSTLVELLDLSGLSDQLNNFDDVGVTLFAPSEDAFHFTSEYVAGLKANETLLRDFLLNHVVPGTYFSGSLRDNQLLITGSELDVHVAVRNGRINEVGISRVVKADIPATNGVIHIVDRVLKSDDTCF